MALVKYWERVPPINEAFASFVGHKPKAVESASSASDDPIEALIRDFEGLG